jgi:predicted nucleic acid-binding protein
MIVVVADTSPLNYLVQIHCQDVLAALYGRVLVPPAVMTELDHPRSPPIVRAWLGHLLPWLEVRGVRSPPGATLAGLDPGEQQAIQLAQEAHADLLLMDERRCVALARRQGHEMTATLGVLMLAGWLALVDIDAALRDLQATDFRSKSGVIVRSAEGWNIAGLTMFLHPTRPIRDEYLIVDGGKLAGTGAHSYSVRTADFGRMPTGGRHRDRREASRRAYKSDPSRSIVQTHTDCHRPNPHRRARGRPRARR